MKKLYSKKLGGEAFALDAAQLDTLKKAGYTVPSPEEVIADAAAVKVQAVPVPVTGVSEVSSKYTLDAGIRLTLVHS